MRILINDHAGHPFQVQLSRSLAFRGHHVLHTFTAGLQTPRGALQRREDDPETFDIAPIALSRPFNRYGLSQRFLQERELGRCLQGQVTAFKPNVVISANTPLGAQAILANACRESGARFIFWLQDLLGVGIRNNLNKKIPFLGDLVGHFYIGLEHRLLRQSRAVVVITDDFVPICQNAEVALENIHVVHNWAPLDEVPVAEKENDWSRAHGLDRTFNLIYSGTLGMKHNPQLLILLAKKFIPVTDVRVVVISEGIGAEFLTTEKTRLGLDNLVLLGFQPFEQVPLVQGAADVLVAILEPDAGFFAVPSKVLTYLCACRPLLLAVPPENLAARIVTDRHAGIVAAPRDEEAFVRGAERLWQDRALRMEMAKNGRRYAEATFDIETIADRFEKIIHDVDKS